MKIRWQGFNLYLAAVVLLAMISGCKTEQGEKEKVLTSLHIHQEIRPDPSGRSEDIKVNRNPEIKMTVDKEAFLTEGKIKEAKVVDAVGGFALKLQFDREGSWLLEEYSAATRGRHIAIFCQFVNPSEKTINHGRWLAAPKISGIITNGELVFTPDASRPETDQIVLGLNNVAHMLETGKEPKF